MKKALLTTALGLASLVAVSAHAQTFQTGQFDVNLSLSPACEINSQEAVSYVVTIGASLNLNYQSFQREDSTDNLDFNVRCTNTLPYSLKITDAAGTGDGETDVTDGSLDLAYTLNLSSNGTYVKGSNNELTGLVGTGVPQPYHIYGTVDAGQAGTCDGVTNCYVTSSDRNIRVIW